MATASTPSFVFEKTKIDGSFCWEKTTKKEHKNTVNKSEQPRNSIIKPKSKPSD